MKAIVHLRRSVEVEVPDCLIPTERSRWDRQEASRAAVDMALSVMEADAWQEAVTGWGRRSLYHPALSWIEWPKSKPGEEGQLTWQQFGATDGTAPTSKG